MPIPHTHLKTLLAMDLSDAVLVFILQVIEHYYTNSFYALVS